MTCSSCANSITQMMSQIPVGQGVVDRIELAQEIADTIDDCGFEAQVVSVHPVRRQEDEEKGTRTVTLKVDGMFCKNCPPKVSAALEPFGSRVEILKPLNDHTDPIITIKYTPDAPDLTIRHIIAALASAKSPPFNVYIHHPLPSNSFPEPYNGTNNAASCTVSSSPSSLPSPLHHRHRVHDAREGRGRHKGIPHATDLVCNTGRIIEAYSKARTADAVTALGSLRPSEVYLLNRRSTDSKERFSIDDDVEKADSVSASGGSEDAPQGFDVEKISAELLEIGDVVRVPHGATPPADGVLIMLPTSEGAFDESSLTGEAKLIKKQAGDRVFLGTINKGTWCMRASIQSVERRCECRRSVSSSQRLIPNVYEGWTAS
ncbi:Cu-transporting P-type ATPase [Salix suchowensis]|nr:Cu-transporting P-type ATPase [Salix suchowensis]